MNSVFSFENLSDNIISVFVKYLLSHKQHFEGLSFHKECFQNELWNVQRILKISLSTRTSFFSFSFCNSLHPQNQHFGKNLFTFSKNISVHANIIFDVISVHMDTNRFFFFFKYFHPHKVFKKSLYSHEQCFQTNIHMSSVFWKYLYPIWTVHTISVLEKKSLFTLTVVFFWRYPFPHKVFSKWTPKLTHTNTIFKNIETSMFNKARPFLFCGGEVFFLVCFALTGYQM